MACAYRDAPDVIVEQEKNMGSGGGLYVWSWLGGGVAHITRIIKVALVFTWGWLRALVLSARCLQYVYICEVKLRVIVLTRRSEWFADVRDAWGKALFSSVGTELINT